MILKIILLLLAAVPLLSLSACNDADMQLDSEQNEYIIAQTPPAGRREVDANERIFRIPLSMNWSNTEYWVIDRYGNEIAAEETSYTEHRLYDHTTADAEPRYIVRTREEVIYDENNRPRKIWWSSLYDLAGNMLIDWEQMTYQFAFGEYIIRQGRNQDMTWVGGELDDFHSALYHVPTGREAHHGTFGTSRLDNGNFLLTGSWWQAPIAIVDIHGEIVAELPEQQFYNIHPWDNYLIASSVNPSEMRGNERDGAHLLDSDFNILFSADWISSPSPWVTRGNYLMFSSGERGGIYCPRHGVVFVADDFTSIQYFDGELAIVETWGSSMGLTLVALTTDSPSITVSTEKLAAEPPPGHVELAGGVSWLIPGTTDDNNAPAEKFIGILDEKIVLIDRTGNEIASTEVIPFIQHVYELTEGFYSYTVSNSLLHYSPTGLLDPNLEVLIPHSAYYGFSIFQHQCESWDAQRTQDIIFGVRNLKTRPHLLDVLDLNGNIIIDNVIRIYDVGPDRIALRRGFSIGLMDFSGNWITRRSIFGTLIDD